MMMPKRLIGLLPKRFADLRIRLSAVPVGLLPPQVLLSLLTPSTRMLRFLTFLNRNLLTALEAMETTDAMEVS